ncbi:hypothetical protein Nepgr_021397 [Nepenthes gracilis]|uniref:Uncharacterized protein n=1 Tax=Nepenthes gracilis TaxID=150966 RepID=A0AAD3SYZ8_NEPGR|nr:hypothetical protein Nepgr_021397 [Nepenthes gracilis]
MTVANDHHDRRLPLPLSSWSSYPLWVGVPCPYWGALGDRAATSVTAGIQASVSTVTIHCSPLVGCLEAWSWRPSPSCQSLFIVPACDYVAIAPVTIPVPILPCGGFTPYATMLSTQC